jgi:hypothetical protein
MDIKELLTQQIVKKLEEEPTTPVEDIVESILSFLDSPESSDEESLNSGVQVWVTLSGHSLTLKDVKDFVARAEQLGLNDSSQVQGTVEAIHNADVEALLAQE